MKSAFLKILLVLFALAWANPASARKIQFRFDSWAGPAMRIFVSRPSDPDPDRPVVFVMHGVNRNADEYRDQWHRLAIEHDFMLVVPEFNQRGFPGPEGYNLGNVYDENRAAVDEANWSFSAIEPIFDEIRRRYSMTAEGYSLYGHSAGSQFVQRFVFHVPDARVNQIVSANAGWYMMPDYEEDYPYGLRSSVVTPDKLQAALNLPVTILLGEEDTDPEHPNLRRTPEALAQGEHRLARGNSFFEAAQAFAERMNVPFNWQLVTVPGAGHDNRLMAPAAVPYLLLVE
jgi:poly(3-hydroxybutyrate) depolymerase